MDGISRVSQGEITHTPKHVLVGLGEPIFRVLPAGILANMAMHGSESALLWNMFYPLARPSIALHDLMAIRLLWGTALSAGDFRDELVPYFWGYDIQGDRLEGLDSTLEAIDAAGPRTEVDLFLRGAGHLVVVEAKNLAIPGRCSRFASCRCPEIHRDEADEVPTGCRYWEADGPRFDSVVDFGERPVPGIEAPPCDQHYQLGRTLLVGTALAARLGLSLHMWLITPSRSWPGLERGWLDFADRVREESVWRRLRVLPWKGIRAIRRS